MYMLFKHRSCFDKRKLPQERNFGKFRELTFGKKRQQKLR